jgi:hypothetical protein
MERGKGEKRLGGEAFALFLLPVYLRGQEIFIESPQSCYVVP